MKKVLIITYYWPPASGPGVYRFLKFCKYLSEFGWEPIVLTVKNGSYPATDHSLLNEVPANVQVYHSHTLEPFVLYNLISGKKGNSVPVGIIPQQVKKNFSQKISFFLRANLFIPDARVGWKFFAIRAAKNIIDEHTIDAVITTGPPHSTHLVGLALKRKFNLPWIADLRDPWTSIYYNKTFPRTHYAERKDKQFEDKVARTADMLVVVSNGLREEFKDRAKNICLIYNGYDETDMPQRKITSTELFRLSYIGSLKPIQNITMMWDVIKELKNENADFKKYFRLQLTGKIDPSIINEIKMRGISDITEYTGYVTHEIATKQMVETNMLLFIIPQYENSKLIITGKLFEYIASTTPILAVGPPNGDADALLKENDRQAMIDYNDEVAFRKNLLAHFNIWLSNNKNIETVNNKNIHRYTRKGLTEQLSESLNQISHVH